MAMMRRMPGHSPSVPAMFALLLFLVTGSTLSAAGQDARTPARDSAAIAALEHEWIDASDSATLDRLLASDFVHPVAQGYFLTKAEHIAWTVAHRPPATLRFRFDRLSVRVYGDAGIVTGVVLTTDTTGTPLERTVFTDVFVYRRGRWQAVNAQETPVVAAGGRH